MSSNITRCPHCNKKLHKQKIVVACAGLLYCSDRCAFAHYDGAAGPYAEVSEEVSAHDVGLDKEVQKMKIDKRNLNRVINALVVSLGDAEENEHHVSFDIGGTTLYFRVYKVITVKDKVAVKPLSKPVYGCIDKESITYKPEVFEEMLELIRRARKPWVYQEGDASEED